MTGRLRPIALTALLGLLAGCTPQPAASSTTGAGWTRVTPSDESFRSSVIGLVQGPTTIVAVGSGYGSASAWVSEDGRSWRSVPAGSIKGGRSAIMVAVARTTTGLVAVGSDDSASETAGAVWTSSDGVTWDRVANVPKPGGEESLEAVAVKDRRIVAVGFRRRADGTPGATVWFSDDAGSHWQRADVSGLDATAFTAVIANDDGFVAVGSFGRWPGVGVTARSPDGLAWTVTKTVALADATLNDVIAIPGGRLLAVGCTHDTPGGRRAAASAWIFDGSRWTQASIPSGEYAACMQAVAVSPRGLVAVGSVGPRGAVWSSDSGTSWIEIGPESMGGLAAPVWLQAVATFDSDVLVAGYESRPLDAGGDLAAIWEWSQ